MLTITSLIVHSNDNIYTNIIDKFAVGTIVIYGAYTVCNKLSIDKYISISLIVLLFLLSIFLYIYGYFTRQFCFCDEKCIAQRYHFVLHAISSIAHHFIIFL